VLYFPYLGGSPHWTDSTQKLHGGWCPRCNHFAKFQIEIFMGYDFTGGRIFDFPIDFCMGLTTVQCYALPVMPLLGQTGIMFSTCLLFVRWCKLARETFNFGGHRSRSHKAKMCHKHPFRRDISITVWRILTTFVVNVLYVTTTRMQKVKVQGHTRPKTVWVE